MIVPETYSYCNDYNMLWLFLGPGQNLCGADGIPFPGWMSDSGCTDANCPLGVCDESGKACCYSR